MGKQHLFQQKSEGSEQTPSSNDEQSIMNDDKAQAREPESDVDKKDAPSFSHPPRPRRTIKRGKFLLLVGLAILVIISSGTGLYLLKTRLLGTSAPQSGSANGPFVTSPLNNTDINDIQHIAEHLKYKQLASLYVSHMSLDDEIAQLLMVEYRYATQYSPELDTMLNQQHVGAVIMYLEQINTKDQTIQDTGEMQKRSNIPVFIAIDQEGWNVNRLANLYPDSLTYFKDADDMRVTGDPNVAASEGQKVAQDMLALGINMNLAPDVDVSTDSNYIGYDGRSFGSTPDEVIKYAGPYMKALQAAGVIGTIKHFPGIGSLLRGDDPHAVLPTITESKDQLFQNDIPTFMHFIQSTDPQERASVVMPTDVMVPSIDATYPAELSHTFITDILRNQLHFDGVVLTDALIMGGVEVNGQPLTLAQAGVLALQAGDDMLMGAGNPTDVQSMIDAIKAAIQNGTLTKARIDEAATRIIALKMASHLMPATVPKV
jgi:beta-N-acetylhexosaminidase